MAGTDTIVGSGSYMPESYYLKKIEKTCLFEDPEQLDNYFRQNLKNMRPEPTFFESDAPRRDNHSASRLNLRHGGRRTLIDPYIPDTFLGFTETDPRGIALGPNMRRHRDQQFARAKFIKYYDDSHNHVPESSISPIQMIKNIKDQFYQVKDRMKIFDTSLDAWHNGGTRNREVTSTGACMLSTDAKYPDMRDEMCYNRSRQISDLSNDTSIGWRRTTDHVFKVARYNQTRLKMGINEQDWVKNRSNTNLTQDILVSYQGQSIPKSLVMKMEDIVKQREMDLASGKHIDFNESRIPEGRKRRIDVSDLNIKRETTETRSEDPHYLLPSAQQPHMSGKSCVPIFDSELADKVILDTTIFDHITSVNNKMTRQQRDDLRNAIVQSAEGNVLLVNQSNKQKNNSVVSNELAWAAQLPHEQQRTLKVANFAGSTTLAKGAGANMGLAEWETYKMTSKEGAQRNKSLRPALYEPDTEFDMDYGAAIEGQRLIAPVGSKFNRQHITGETGSEHGLDEVSSMNSVRGSRPALI